jgi:hypothetical protein
LRIDPPAGGLRSDLGGEDPAREGAQRRHDRQEPHADGGALDDVAEDLLAVGAERFVARQPAEHELFQELERPEEEHRHDPGDGADDRRVEQRAADELEVERGGLGEQRVEGPPLCRCGDALGWALLWHGELAGSGAPRERRAPRSPPSTARAAVGGRKRTRTTDRGSTRSPRARPLCALPIDELELRIPDYPAERRALIPYLP